MKTIDLIQMYDPCGEAKDWLVKQDPKTAWEKCPRADWMLWILAKMGLPRPLLVQAACDCALTALEHTNNSDTWMISLLCIHIVQEWSEGREDLETVRAVRSYAAAYAAYAAYAADYADYAAYAAYAASAASAADYADYARSTALARMADLVRARIPWSEVEKLLKEKTNG